MIGQFATTGRQTLGFFANSVPERNWLNRLPLALVDALTQSWRGGEDGSLRLLESDGIQKVKPARPADQALKWIGKLEKDWQQGETARFRTFARRRLKCGQRLQIRSESPCNRLAGRENGNKCLLAIYALGCDAHL